MSEDQPGGPQLGWGGPGGADVKWGWRGRPKPGQAAPRGHGEDFLLCSSAPFMCRG